MNLAFSCRITFALSIALQILSAEIRFVQMEIGGTIPIKKSEISPTLISSNQTIPLKETNGKMTSEIALRSDSGKKFSFLLDSDDDVGRKHSLFNNGDKQKATGDPKEKSLDLITNTDVQVLQLFVQKLKSSLVAQGRDAGLQNDNQDVRKIKWDDRKERYRKIGYDKTKGNSESLENSQLSNAPQILENSGRLDYQGAMTNNEIGVKTYQNDTVNEKLAPNRLNDLSDSDMDILHFLVKDFKRLNSTKVQGNHTKTRKSGSKTIRENFINGRDKGHFGSSTSTQINEHFVSNRIGPKTGQSSVEVGKGFHWSKAPKLSPSLKQENNGSSLDDQSKQLKQIVERAIANTSQRLMELLKLEKQLKRPSGNSNAENDDVDYTTSLIKQIKKMHKALNSSTRKKSKENKEKSSEKNLKLNKKSMNETESGTKNQSGKQESTKPDTFFNLVKLNRNSSHKHSLQKDNNNRQQQQQHGPHELKEQQQRMKEENPRLQKQYSPQLQQRSQRRKQQQLKTLGIKGHKQRKQNDQQRKKNNYQLQLLLNAQLKSHLHSQSQPQPQEQQQLQPSKIEQQKQEREQQQTQSAVKQEKFQIVQNLSTVEQQQSREQGKASTLQTSNNSLNDKLAQNKVLKAARLLHMKVMKHLIASMMENPFDNWIYHQKTFDELGITPSLIKSGIVNLGSSKLIRSVVRKAVKGKPLNMMVVGGFISAGGGLWKDRGNTDGIYHKALSSWWERTITPVTGSDIKVNNVAIGGTDSEYFSYCLNNFFEGDPDLVLWELSANDYNKYNERDFDPSKPLEQLTRVILQLPSHPALIYINFFRGDQQNFELNEKCPDFEETEVDILSRYYDIPSLSWRRMVCNLITKRTLFERELFGDDGYHPSLLGHAQVAMLLTMYMKGVFESVLADDLENLEKLDDENGDFDLHDSEDFQLKIPAFKNLFYPKPCCWTLLTPDYTKHFHNTLSDMNVLNGDGFELNNVTVWDVRTDRVQCLLATKPGATLDLTLNVPVLDDDKNLPLSDAQTRTLAIATHNKYGGAAEVQLDELPSKMSVVTEGERLKRTEVHIVSENVRPGVHNLRFRSLSSGFCLTSIMVL